MARPISRALFCCVLSAFTFFAVVPASAAAGNAMPSSTSPGYRVDHGGWAFVHLKGTPAEIGYQHGRLLSAEIEDLVKVIKLESTHETRRDWQFFRESSRKMLWPHIDAEYKQELEGIAKGVQSKGVKLDVWDIVALNGGIELPQRNLTMCPCEIEDPIGEPLICILL